MGGDLVSKEEQGEKAEALAFVRRRGSAGGVSFIPLPTLSGNNPPSSDAEHRDASKPPLPTSLCALVNLSNHPPLFPSACLAASNTNPSERSTSLFFLFLRFHRCSNRAFSTLFSPSFFFFREMERKREREREWWLISAMIIFIIHPK